MANKFKTTTKQRKFKTAVNRQTYSPFFWYFVGAIVVIGVIIVYFLSYSPKTVPAVTYANGPRYTGSDSMTTLSTQQSVSVDVSGRYAVIHVFSGPSKDVGGLLLEKSPTISGSDGTQVVRLSIIQSYGDTSSSNPHNFDYVVKLKDPLQPGQYKVAVIVNSQYPPNRTLYNPYTLTTGFHVE